MIAALRNPTNLFGLYDGLRTSGVDTVNGSPVYVVGGQARATGQAEKLYFDQGSGLLVRRYLVSRAAYGSFTTDTYYEAYRRVGGIMLPIMISEFSPDFGSVRKLRTIEFNSTFSTSIFSPPR